MSRITANTCPAAATCTLSAIANDSAVLSSPSTTDLEKLTALKFLGHWVGDIHQPLHVSFEDDRGGNEVLVDGECSGNVHATWDTCLVLKAVGSDVSAAATDLLKTVTPAKTEEWTQASNPRDWANESLAITRGSATKYCVREGSSCNLPSGEVDVDAGYVQRNVSIVRQQLAKAAVRLAHLLDAAFGN
jgi:hypothetical protein